MGMLTKYWSGRKPEIKAEPAKRNEKNFRYAGLAFLGGILSLYGYHIFCSHYSHENPSSKERRKPGIEKKIR